MWEDGCRSGRRNALMLKGSERLNVTASKFKVTCGSDADRDGRNAEEMADVRDVQQKGT